MFESMNEKQIRDRLRYLSDKIEDIWENITPVLKEFTELENEFGELYKELDNRGSLDAPQSRESIGKNTQ